MKKAIVTGANGFVGSWLVKELAARNVTVYAVVRDADADISRIGALSNVKIFYCNLENIRNLPESITDRDIECFYHLAWAGAWGGLRADHNVQLSNAGYCCDAAYAAKQIGCEKFLCAGTVSENIADGVSELDKVSQNMMYAICKQTARKLLSVYCRMIDIKLIWMQFSNIYGPGDRTNNLICYTLTEILNNRKPTFSKGSQPYDFIFIKDLVHAVYLLGSCNIPSDKYFLGSGNGRPLCEYLSEIPEILGNGCQVGLGERPEDGIVYNKEWFDISKLQKDTGFVSQYSFEEGIKETFQWLKENK